MTEKSKKARKGQDAPSESSKTILINFVLDKSGSMEHLRESTISGFNEFVSGQRNVDGEVYMNLVLFDTEFTMIHESTPIAEVADLDHASYQPGGCTALYDAIGHTMKIADDFYEARKPDQVLFVIMTDGLENASRVFTHDRIFQMIEDRQKLAEYEFIYFGANQDSYAASESIGIREGRSMDFSATPAATREMMRRASRNVSAYRRHAEKHAAVMFDEDFEAMADAKSDEELRSLKHAYATKAHAIEEERRRRAERATGPVPSTDVRGN